MTTKNTPTAAAAAKAGAPTQVDPASTVTDNLSAATDVAGSGALVEPEISELVDTTHPAVDDEPRKGLPKASNRIDFNDPTLSPEEAVARNLQGEG